MNALNSFSALEEEEYHEPKVVAAHSDDVENAHQKKQRQPPLIGSNRMPMGEYKVRGSAVEYKPKVVNTTEGAGMIPE